jgi:ribosomal protein S15P/S13E
VSFDDEWNRLVSAAAQRKSTQTRLNQLDGGEGGGGAPQGDLSVDQKDLAAIGDEAFKLRGRLVKDGDHARASSYSAAAALRKDFEIGGALDHVTTRWKEQLRTLTDACAHISNHLEYTDRAHSNDEHYISGLFNSLSQLDEGFDERTQR